MKAYEFDLFVCIFCEGKCASGEEVPKLIIISKEHCIETFSEQLLYFRPALVNVVSTMITGLDQINVLSG